MKNSHARKLIANKIYINLESSQCEKIMSTWKIASVWFYSD